MKIVEKFSLHFPYGLFCQVVDQGENKTAKLNGIYNDGSCVFHDIVESEHGFDSVKPYLRSFDQLIKECVQSDYNDGKPFIPIEELNKTLGYTEVSIVNFINTGVGYYINNGADTALSFSKDIFPIMQQLLKWHFAVGFESGEYIEVTNENNPY